MSQTGFSRSSVYLRVAQGLLPKPISLGSRAVGWPEEEITQLNVARIAGQTNAAVSRLVEQLMSARKTVKIKDDAVRGDEKLF